MSLKQQLLQKIVTIPGYLELEPVVASIGPIPFRTNSRRLYTYPAIVELFAEVHAQTVADVTADIVAGGVTAGIPLALAVSLKTRKPFIYVRKDEKIKGGVSQGTIEGDFKSGQRVLLCDDVVGTGETKIKFIKHLDQAGLQTVGIALIMETNGPLSPEVQQLLDQRKILMQAAFSWEEVTQALIAGGQVPAVLAPLMLDYVRDPQRWRTTPEKWQVYLRHLRELNLSYDDAFKQYE